MQREPDLLLAVKRAVDEGRPRHNGRFVLTGSANLLLMRRVSETLAGRATYVNLWPLSRRERLGRGASHRLGGLINQAGMGRDLQMPRATVQRYLVRLPSYSVNRTKRLVKHPKLYWSDPALAVWLSGADTG